MHVVLYLSKKVRECGVRLKYTGSPESDCHLERTSIDSRADADI